MTPGAWKRITLCLGLVLADGPSLMYAQSNRTSQPYRIAPPLRIAQRSSQFVASAGSDSDPYQPHDSRNQPKTVALNGFCLVTLRDRGTWVHGDKSSQATRGSKIYLFASPRERDIFIASPERYLPALDGDCVVTFAESGKRTPGSLQWGLLYQQRIFFFASQEKLEHFKAVPEDYVNIDLVDEGRCIVSKIDDHREVAGLPETVVIVDGRRYFFADVWHRNHFLSNPQHYGITRKSAAENVVGQGRTGGTMMASEGASFGDERVSASSEDAHFRPSSKATADGKSRKKKDSDEATEKVEVRAMSGYCPVTIRTAGSVETRQIEAIKQTYDGKVYFMAGPEELAAFEANPSEYVPVLSGDSVVTFANDHHTCARKCLSCRPNTKIDSICLPMLDES